MMDFSCEVKGALREEDREAAVGLVETHLEEAPSHLRKRIIKGVIAFGITVIIIIYLVIDFIRDLR